MQVENIKQKNKRDIKNCKVAFSLFFGIGATILTLLSIVVYEILFLKEGEFLIQYGHALIFMVTMTTTFILVDKHRTTFLKCLGGFLFVRLYGFEYSFPRFQRLETPEGKLFLETIVTIIDKTILYLAIIVLFVQLIVVYTYIIKKIKEKGFLKVYKIYV